MVGLFAISRATLANALATSLFAAAVAAQDASTDVGTLDKEAAEKAFPAKPPYSPYAGRNFPTRPLLRRHASAHFVFDGRGRVWLPGSARRTPIASPRARRSSLRVGSVPSCRGRWISWW